MLVQLAQKPQSGALRGASERRLETSKLLGGLLASVFLSAALSAEATPCEEFAVPLFKAKAALLERAVAKQLHVQKTTIQRDYSNDPWTVLYVLTSDLDRTYLIYASDPLSNRYVTLWGGTPDDYTEDQVLDWTRTNAPGIPDTLAQCLAWSAVQPLAP